MDKHLTPRSQAKRAAILQAAQESFLDLGYSKTSMDAVAQRAAVSKATIYFHFASKTDLFTAVIRRRCDDYGDGLSCLAVSSGQDGRQAVTALTHHVLSFLTQPEVLAMYRMVLSESPHQPELAQLFYEQGPMRGKERIAEILGQLMERGLIPAADPQRMTEILTAMLRGDFYNRTLLGLPPRPGYGLQDTVALVVDTFMGSLSCVGTGKSA